MTHTRAQQAAIEAVQCKTIDDLMSTFAQLLGMRVSYRRGDTLTVGTTQLVLVAEFDAYTQVEYGLAHLTFGVPAEGIRATIRKFGNMPPRMDECAIFLEDMRVRSLWGELYPGSAENIEDMSGVLFRGLYALAREVDRPAALDACVADVLLCSHEAIYPAALALSTILAQWDQEKSVVEREVKLPCDLRTMSGVHAGGERALADAAQDKTFDDAASREAGKAALDAVRNRLRPTTKAYPKVRWSEPARAKKLAPLSATAASEADRLAVALGQRQDRKSRQLDVAGLELDVAAYVEGYVARETHVWRQHHRDRGTHVVLLVDESGSIRPVADKLNETIRVLERALRRTRIHLEVIGFHGCLGTYLRHHDPRAPGVAWEGSTPLVEAVEHCVERWASQRKRGVVIVLTDGAGDTPPDKVASGLEQVRRRASFQGIQVEGVIFGTDRAGGVTFAISREHALRGWGPRVQLVGASQAPQQVARCVYEQVRRGG